MPALRLRGSRSLWLLPLAIAMAVQGGACSSDDVVGADGDSGAGGRAGGAGGGGRAGAAGGAKAGGAGTSGSSNPGVGGKAGANAGGSAGRGGGAGVGGAGGKGGAATSVGGAILDAGPDVTSPGTGGVAQEAGPDVSVDAPDDVVAPPEQDVAAEATPLEGGSGGAGGNEGGTDAFVEAGAGGSATDSGDQPDVADTGTPGSLKAQLKTMTDVTSAQFDVYIEVWNTGTGPVPVAPIKVRYYFTSDAGDAGGTVKPFIYTAQVHGSTYFELQGTATTQTLVPPKSNADSYAEVILTSSQAIPAGDVINLYVQIQRQGSNTPFDLSNDFSAKLTGTAGAYEDWPNIPVYVGNTLVWGAEP